MDMDTETIEEVDEAIFHAYLTRSQTIDSKKHIIDKPLTIYLIPDWS